jgi:hypothetical protein
MPKCKLCENKDLAKIVNSLRRDNLPYRAIQKYCMENLNYPLSLKALSIHFQHTALEQAKIPQLKENEILLPREVVSKLSDTLSKALRENTKDADVVESYYNWISTVNVEEPKILTNFSAYRELSFYILGSPLPEPIKQKVYQDFKQNYFSLLSSNSIPTSNLETTL